MDSDYSTIIINDNLEGSYFDPNNNYSLALQADMNPELIIGNKKSETSSD